VQITQFATPPVSMPNGLTIGAGGRLVIAKNPAVFQSVYGTGINLAPVSFADDSLSNGGERIVLLGSVGQIIQDFSFDDAAPWPTSADGGGYSIEMINPLGDPTSPANWRASFYAGGSPGTEGLPPVGAPGDFDDDDDVDGSDFLAWQRGLGMSSGASRADGDADGDQDVDADDLGMWRTHFGAAPGSASFSSAAMVLSASGETSTAALFASDEWLVATPIIAAKAPGEQVVREPAVDESIRAARVRGIGTEPPRANTSALRADAMYDLLDGSASDFAISAELDQPLDEALVDAALTAMAL
jgi:hypothetical protein